MTPQPVVITETDAGVGWVTLNRPDRLNSLTRQMCQELLATLETLAVDDDIRVVVLTGAGRGFCAGGDLAVGLHDITGTGPLADQTAQLAGFGRIAHLLVEMPKVTIAAVNGPCAGAGLSLACAADLRLASDTARFATAFLGAALSGDFGGTWSLARILGPAKAKELYLSGAKVGAEEARRLGLVSDTFAGDELIPQTHELAARLAAAAPLAIAAIKQNFSSLMAGVDLTLAAEAARHVVCMSTRDAEEAVQAFLERRAPTFVGS